MKADRRIANSVVAKSGRFDIARPDLTKAVYVVLCDGEVMESFPTLQAACDACDKRKKV